VALVSMILLGGVIGLLLFNTSMQQASFAATSLESQASTLSAREQTLRMELDVLRNPQHVAEQARRMGMLSGGSPAFLSLPDGKILGDASPADPAQNVRILPPAPPKPAVLAPAPTYVDAPPSGDRDGHGASSSAEGDGQGRNSHDSNKSNRDHTSNSALD
jgi:hypothetical protein